MNKKLIGAYESVIEDLSADIGYEPETLQSVIAVLRGRVYELTEVHPWMDIVDNLHDVFREEEEK